MKLLFYFMLIPILLVVSCTGNESKNTPETRKDSFPPKKENKPSQKTETNSKKPPIINIVDTVSPKRMIVYIKDSASTFERIRMKLGQIYAFKLPEFFKRNELKIMGPPMAWYSTEKAPFFFEAGLPVNKKPAKLTPGLNLRELAADSTVVAHFYGPYDLLYMGYDALKEWMKDHNKTASGTAYEIYINDPVDKKSKRVDPYKVQTEIVFPRK